MYRLHSKYQPQDEADRYIKSLQLDTTADCFILVEPGEGYLINALERARPDCRIIVLHADGNFRQTDGRYKNITAWYPDSEISVQEFLDSAIPEYASIRVIEWRPGIHAYGESCLALLRECADFVKRADASRRTSAAFGRRWVRNFFRNAAFMQETLLFGPGDCPVVITGSGPGLETALPALRAAKEKIFIIAASSSLPALAAGGVTADMAISTDGGGWALLHLYALCRNKTKRPASLAMTLNAAIPSQCLSIPVLPISDGSLWQSLALHSVGIPSALIPQRGTVTATALELAMQLSSGRIFLAGMDLSVNDIRSHARPYGFDHLFWGAASRFSPAYTQFFVRSGAIRDGGSYNIYAAWFKNKIASCGGQSLSGKIVTLGGVNSAPGCSLPHSSLFADDAALGGHNFQKITFSESAVNGKATDRLCAMTGALSAALQNKDHSQVLITELSPLLFPSGKNITAQEISQTLVSLAGRYCGQKLFF